MMNKDIIFKLSLKYKLPIAVVEKIIASQFDFTRDVMTQGNDEQVRLQYLGLFKVKDGRRELVQKRRRVIKDSLHAKKEGRQEK